MFVTVLSTVLVNLTTWTSRLSWAGAAAAIEPRERSERKLRNCIMKDCGEECKNCKRVTGSLDAKERLELERDFGTGRLKRWDLFFFLFFDGDSEMKQASTVEQNRFLIYQWEFQRPFRRSASL